MMGHDTRQGTVRQFTFLVYRVRTTEYLIKNELTAAIQGLNPTLIE